MVCSIACNLLPSLFREKVSDSKLAIRQGVLSSKMKYICPKAFNQDCSNGGPRVQDGPGPGVTRFEL